MSILVSNFVQEFLIPLQIPCIELCGKVCKCVTKMWVEYETSNTPQQIDFRKTQFLRLHFTFVVVLLLLHYFALLFSPVQSCSVLFSSVQSCSVLFSPALSCSVPAQPFQNGLSGLVICLTLCAWQPFLGLKQTSLEHSKNVM